LLRPSQIQTPTIECIGTNLGSAARIIALIPAEDYPDQRTREMIAIPEARPQHFVYTVVYIVEETVGV
jgi:hypothetical protein